MTITSYNATLTNSFHKNGSGSATSANWLSGLKTGRYWGSDSWVDLPPPALPGEGYWVHNDGSYGNRFGFIWFDCDAMRTAMANQTMSSITLSLRRTDTAGYSPSRAVNGSSDKYLYVYGLKMASSQSGGTLPGNSNGVSETYLTNDYITYGSAIARSSSISVTISASVFRDWLDNDDIDGIMIVDGDDTGATAGYVDGDGVNGRSSSNVGGEFNGSTYGYMTFGEYNDSSYKPVLSITHEPALPDEPVIDSVGTITTNPYTFNWSDVTNVEPASSMYYDYTISFDGGSVWETIVTTAQGVSQASVDIKSLLSLTLTQYYYNDNVKFAVRSRTSGDVLSDWSFTSIFTIDYRIVPSAPADLDATTAGTYYEGDPINFNVNRPSTYNAKDESGVNNVFDYEVRLADDTVLVSDSAPFTDADIDIAYTIGNITDGDDLSTTIKARVTDSENQVSPYISGVSFDVKRYQIPVFTVDSIDREETTATINFTVTDTGYGSSDQTSSKIRYIRYSLAGAGLVTATLGTWVGLSNSFTITGLSADTSYSLSLILTNDDPDGNVGKDSEYYNTTIYQNYPVFYAWENSTTGKSGISAKSIYAGSDFTVEPDDGEILAENKIGVNVAEASVELQVKTDTDGGGILIQRSSTSADSYAQLGFSNTTGEANVAQSYIRVYRRTAYANNDMYFAVGNNVRFVIKDDGTLLAGTTNEIYHEGNRPDAMYYRGFTTTDLDTLLSTGYYKVGSTATNAPSPGAVGILTVKTASDYCSQEHVRATNGRLHIRFCNDITVTTPVWSSWVEK